MNDRQKRDDLENQARKIEYDAKVTSFQGEIDSLQKSADESQKQADAAYAKSGATISVVENDAEVKRTEALARQAADTLASKKG
jgi:hypothetical protein